MPTAKYATAAVRKGVHIYSKQDILRSSGAEEEKEEDNGGAKTRKRFVRIQNQKLHKQWRLHKAAKMIDEDKETRKAIEDITGKYRYPDLEAFWGPFIN